MTNHLAKTLEDIRVLNELMRELNTRGRNTMTIDEPLVHTVTIRTPYALRFFVWRGTREDVLTKARNYAAQHGIPTLQVTVR